MRLLRRSDPGAAVTAAADAVNALVRVRQPERALETAGGARRLAPLDGQATDLEATSRSASPSASPVGSARQNRTCGAPRRCPPPARRSPARCRPAGCRQHSAGSATDEEAHTYLAETVRRARAAGAVGALPHLLVSSARQALHASSFNAACADAGEALALAQQCEQPVTAAQALGVLTWLHALQGDEERCRAYGDDAKRRADELGFPLYELLVSLCFGLLDLGRGRVERSGSACPASGYGTPRGRNLRSPR